MKVPEPNRHVPSCHFKIQAELLEEMKRNFKILNISLDLLISLLWFLRAYSMTTRLCNSRLFMVNETKVVEVHECFMCKWIDTQKKRSSCHRVALNWILKLWNTVRVGPMFMFSLA